MKQFFFLFFLKNYVERHFMNPNDFCTDEELEEYLQDTKSIDESDAIFDDDSYETHE